MKNSRKKPRTTRPRKPPPQPKARRAPILKRYAPIYSEAVVEELCARMAGGESLPQICRDAHMPNRWTVYNWAQTKPEFLARFNEARERLCDYWADEILDISDNSTNDFMLREHGVVLDAEHIQRSRLRVDSRKWLLSKLAHTKYGDRLLTQTQQLDANGNAVDPAPVIVIGRDEAEAIGRELDEKV